MITTVISLPLGESDSACFATRSVLATSAGSNAEDSTTYLSGP